MPLYEYLCNKGHHFELWETLGADTTRHCTECKSRAHRIMSRTHANFDAVSTPADFRDSRRESDYDRKLAAAFPMKFAIEKAAKRLK